MRLLTWPAFVKAFLAACARRNVQATTFPEEWAVYLPSGLHVSTQQATSTATPSASTGSMTASSTSRTTAVNIFGPVSTTSSSLTTTMTSSATETANMTQASSTNWADLQIPICGVRTAGQNILNQLTSSRSPRIVSSTSTRTMDATRTNLSAYAT